MCMYNLMLILCIVQVDTVYEGKTALHVAIEEGSPTAVKLLLEYNANMELQVKIDLQFQLGINDCIDYVISM